MTRIDIEKKLSEILFRRGYVLTYTEVEPSSENDMYEITFYLENDQEKTVYRTMFIRNEKNPKKKAFTLLLDEIIDSYYENENIGTKEDPITT
jgi:hypothetical protein